MISEIWEYSNKNHGNINGMHIEQSWYCFNMQTGIGVTVARFKRFSNDCPIEWEVRQSSLPGMIPVKLLRADAARRFANKIGIPFSEEQLGE